MTRADSEAIVLGPNVFVFLESHLHKRLARDVISFSTTTFTKEFVRFFGHRHRRLLGRLVDLLDPFVDLPDESFVACLSFLASFTAKFYAFIARRTTGLSEPVPALSAGTRDKGPRMHV